MGQRIQIIIKIPKIFFNDNNVNNEDEQILVFHNQWLYGMNFIKYQNKLLKTLKYLLNSNNYYEYKRTISQAIGVANHHDLDNITNSSIYDSDNENKTLLNSTNTEEFLNHYDNNNGYCFIEIHEDKSLSYCFINGNEDDDEIKIRTPIEYLSLFYSFEEIAAAKKIHLVFKELEQFKTTDAFKVLDTLRIKLKDKQGDSNTNTA